MNLVQHLKLDLRFLDIQWLMRQLHFWMRKPDASQDARILAFRINLRVCLSLIVNLHHWWICTRYWTYSMLYLKLQMNRDICRKRLDPLALHQLASCYYSGCFLLEPLLRCMNLSAITSIHCSHSLALLLCFFKWISLDLALLAAISLDLLMLDYAPAAIIRSCFHSCWLSFCLL